MLKPKKTFMNSTKKSNHSVWFFIFKSIASYCCVCDWSWTEFDLYFSWWYSNSMHRSIAPQYKSREYIIPATFLIDQKFVSNTHEWLNDLFNFRPNFYVLSIFPFNISISFSFCFMFIVILMVHTILYNHNNQIDKRLRWKLVCDLITAKCDCFHR